MSIHDSSSAIKPGFDPFIVSTSLDKPDGETRKFIRSHVMRGKNTRRGKRSKALAQRVEQRRDQWPPKEREQGEKQEERDDQEWILTTPRKIASELSLFGYVTDIKPYMLDLIARAFTVIKPATYTIETALVEGTRDRVFCFSNVSQSPAMIHSVLFTAQAFHDLTIGASYGKVAQFHLAKTLYYLQRILDDGNEATTNTTMAVVTSLATAAAIFGDLETAAKHIDGLHRMVELRGGLKSLGQGSMIEHKAQRIDLGLAIGTGSKTRFFREDISWSPSIAHGRPATRFPELSLVHPRPDPRLLNIWADLREFSRTANEATETGVKMAPNIFSQLTTSVPHRLVSLQFDPTSLHELLRLCMLAYMKSVLIQIEGIGKKMAFLAGRLKTALLAQQHPPHPEGADILLWALFIAGLSIFEDFDRDWLRAAMGQAVLSLRLRTWEEARVVVKRFLWIDIVYEQPGKRLFEEWFVNSSRDGG